MTDDATIEKIAKGAHNTFANYCKVLGDYSIKEWDEAQDWQRESTRSLVRNVLTGEFSSEVEHGRWKKGKEIAGYVWGPEKNDDEAKGPLTNPNMKPYADLPLSARLKDHLLIIVALGLASHYGVPIAKDIKLSYA